MALHKTFKKVNKAADLVKQEVRAGYFRLDDLEKVERLKALGEKLAEIYGVPALPKVVINPGIPQFGTYNIVTWKVTLRKPSIVSFLHEFRHHLQRQGNIQVVRDKEHDAQAWACSVYYRGCPERYLKAAREGKIMGVTL